MTFTHGLLAGGLVVGAFCAGLMWADGPWGRGGGALAADVGPRLVLPQGRGVRPPISNPNAAGTAASDVSDLPTEAEAPAPLVYGGDGGQSGAANGFIAVTGSYGVGTSVLYVMDTQARQIAVYEARGGSSGSRRLVFVGARRIDLDLRLEAYNDKSDYLFRDLQREFASRGSDATGAAGSATGGGASSAPDPSVRRETGGRE